MRCALLDVMLGPEQPDTPSRVHLTFEAFDPEAAIFFDSLTATTDGEGCTPTLLTTSVASPDDGFSNARRDDTACWLIRARMNDTVERIYEPQLFLGWLTVHVEGGADARHSIGFLVPQSVGLGGPD